MILGILQARMSSSRLPGKVLLPLAGGPSLLRQVERLRRCRRLDALVVATSTDASDDPIAALCANHGIDCHRGSLDDVLARFYDAAEVRAARHIVRLTADCPLTDPEIIDALVDFYLEGNYDYASNTLERTFPDGLDAEIFRKGVLEVAFREATAAADREHVTPYIRRHPECFRLGSFRGARDLSEMRWTVDEPEDYRFVCAIYDRLYSRNPAFGMDDVLGVLRAEPGLMEINRRQVAGATSSEAARAATPAGRCAAAATAVVPRYARSQALLGRALRTIPGGSQTFSKSHIVYPGNAAPLFLTRGQGSRVWDVDGNEYVDFVNGLASIVLGYGDPDVDAAVRAQLERGVNFSLATELEVELAELLCGLIPCAEQVRFGKNGSDATAAAVRIARAYTGRERIAAGGYHGWQDWYVGATSRNKGVPAAVAALTHPFPYNDLDALRRLLESHPGEFAAVIMEPMSTDEPLPGYLEAVRRLAHEHGALFILDEIVTGFRFHLGGAQTLFGVVPDLATFGKGMANGFPLSAIVGRARYMREMDEIFFSSTFGGEALSLAASLATLRKMRRESVHAKLEETGRRVITLTRANVERSGLSEAIVIGGHPSWSHLRFRDCDGASAAEIKSLYLQEMLARGVLVAGSHNMSYAHTDDDLALLDRAQREALAAVRDALDAGEVAKRLAGAPIRQVFQIRR